MTIENGPGVPGFTREKYHVGLAFLVSPKLLTITVRGPTSRMQMTDFDSSACHNPTQIVLRKVLF